MASYFYYVKGMDVVVVDCDYPQFSIKDMRERDLKNIERNPKLQKAAFEQFARLQRECTRLWKAIPKQPSKRQRLSLKWKRRRTSSSLTCPVR